MELHVSSNSYDVEASNCQLTVMLILCRPTKGAGQLVRTQFVGLFVAFLKEIQTLKDLVCDPY